MRVLVAGATGAIGRPLIPALIEAGHEVAGTTRSEERARTLRDAGAEAVVVDATDAAALEAAVAEAKPEVVVNQLTALPDALDFRDREGLAATNRLRGEVCPVLASAAAKAGARRLVSQSVAFFYAATGSRVKSEQDPLMRGAAGSMLGDAAVSLKELERSTIETDGIDGVVLRYGYFYGPGTYYGQGGSTREQVSKRRFPVVGKGTGVFSFIHVDDAASATVAAIESDVTGTFNVTDDEPAQLSEWLPVYAESIGAKPPRSVPAWLARIAAGKEAAGLALELRGASNAKAKRELGWEPGRASWRRGFAA